MDTVKIRLQLQIARYGQYKGASSTFISIIKNEGVRALWKGNVPAELMYIIYGGVQFTSYSILSKKLNEFEETNAFNIKFSGSTHSLFVGAGAGLTSTFATYPFDLLRTRLVANSSREFLSMKSTILNIWSREGISGFFIGFKPAAVSVASTTGLMFWAYEIAREFSSQYKDNVPFIEGFCGFLAGATSKGITFPLDTIRKRMQMHNINNSGSNTRPSTLQICKSILRNEGVFGVYKGYGMSVLKTAPTSALSLFMFEYSLQILRETTKGSPMP